jgi:hypothetical protein
LGGFGNERRIKKSINKNFISMQKHQTFLTLQTPNSGNARENKEALE